MEKTNKSDEPAARDPVPAVTRAFDILEYLQGRNRAVGLNEIATELGIPRASSFRIMRALLERGYVNRSSDGPLYVLGARFLALGSTPSFQKNLGEIANPFMYQLAETSGQSVQLGVLFEYQVMYIDQIRVTNALTLAVPTFQPYAVNLSAGGKVLVAFLEEDRKIDFLQNTILEQNTARSIVDKAAFSNLLDKIKLDGYAIDDGEFAEGIRCVAAPIFDRRGVNIASLGVTGHVLEIDDRKLQELITTTVNAANSISDAYRSRQGEAHIR